MKNYPTLGPLDKWLRRRLTSILRVLSKRKSISPGYDHIHWPNKQNTFRAVGFLIFKEPTVPYSSPNEVNPPAKEPEA